MKGFSEPPIPKVDPRPIKEIPVINKESTRDLVFPFLEEDQFYYIGLDSDQKCPIKKGKVLSTLKNKIIATRNQGT